MEWVTWNEIFFKHANGFRKTVYLFLLKRLPWNLYSDFYHFFLPKKTDINIKSDVRGILYIWKSFIDKAKLIKKKKENDNNILKNVDIQYIKFTEKNIKHL